MDAKLIISYSERPGSIRGHVHFVTKRRQRHQKSFDILVGDPFCVITVTVH